MDQDQITTSNKDLLIIDQNLRTMDQDQRTTSNQDLLNMDQDMGNGFGLENYIVVEP